MMRNLFGFHRTWGALCGGDGIKTPQILHAAPCAFLRCGWRLSSRLWHAITTWTLVAPNFVHVLCDQSRGISRGTRTVRAVVQWYMYGFVSITRPTPNHPPHLSLPAARGRQRPQTIYKLQADPFRSNITLISLSLSTKFSATPMVARVWPELYIMLARPHQTCACAPRTRWSIFNWSHLRGNLLTSYAPRFWVEGAGI